MKKFMILLLSSFLFTSSLSATPFQLTDSDMSVVTAGKWVDPNVMQRWVYDRIKSNLKGNSNKYGNWGKTLNESNFRSRITVNSGPKGKANNRFVIFNASTPQQVTNEMGPKIQAYAGKEWETRIRRK